MVSCSGTTKGQSYNGAINDPLFIWCRTGRSVFLMAPDLSRRDFLTMTGMAIGGAAVSDLRAARAAHAAEAAAHGALLRFPRGFLWGAATL